MRFPENTEPGKYFEVLWKDEVLLDNLIILADKPQHICHTTETSVSVGAKKLPNQTVLAIIKVIYFTLHMKICLQALGVWVFCHHEQDFCGAFF